MRKFEIEEEDVLDINQDDNPIQRIKWIKGRVFGYSDLSYDDIQCIRSPERYEYDDED